MYKYYEHLNYCRCLEERGITAKLARKLWDEKLKLAEFFRRIHLVSERALEAFMRVPRECFVRREHIKYSYIDEPLPIARDATISAISMSLLFLDYAELDVGDKVLEIGTGSGYQAALIAEMVYPRDERGRLIPSEEPLVRTIEISPNVFEFGRKNLEVLGYDRYVKALLGDGTLGWPEDAKFDVIIVTAAGDRVPQPLLEQLKVGGRLLMPLGRGFWQTLIRVRRVGEEGRPSDFIRENLDEVRFVPLKGKYGIEG